MSFKLKGGVTYFEYVWNTEPGACEVCQSLNGKRFTNPEDIPNKPHPNCRCWVEVSNEDDNQDGWGSGNNNSEYDMSYPNPNEPNDDELCDCDEQFLDEIIYKLEEGKGRAQSLADDYNILSSKMMESKNHFEEIIQNYKNMLQEVEDEISKHLEFCDNTYNYFKDFIIEKINELSLKPQSIGELIELIAVGTKVTTLFIGEYINLLYEAYVLKRAGLDKYRHSVANCEGPQFGEIGEKVAIFLSDFKEHFDQWEDVYAKSHGVTLEEAKADSERDQVANALGRLRGKTNPTCNCRELMKDLIPKSHRDKY